MPTYDYKCDGCGHMEEVFQSMSDKPKRTCPKCKARKFKRLIGMGAGVIFKGSGFYETDYRSESYKKAAEAEKSGGKADGKKGEKDGSAAEKKGTKKKPTDSKNEGGGCGPSCACAS